MLDYDGFATNVKGLGPGVRTVLWVRGCGTGCKGCMTKYLWPHGEPRPIEQLVDQMLPSLRQSEGLTISGGEPFDQPEQLALLIDLLRTDHDVHVFCYSGYRLERLQKQTPAKTLLQRLDMLMDGPFIESQPTEKVWRGSDNQHLHLISDRAKRQPVDDSDWRQIQLQPLAAGGVRLIGIPKRGDIDKLRLVLQAKGLQMGSDL